MLLGNYLDNIALQEIVFAIVMARKRQLTKEDTQTSITLKSIGLYLREIGKKAKVRVSIVSYTIKRHSETGGNSNSKQSGRPKATTESEVSKSQQLV